MSAVLANDKVGWVIGSYVNVRTQPSRNAEIVDHLVANTQVKLLAQHGDFCEITWRNNQRGFVACNFLGDTTLRIEDVGAKPKYNEKPNPQYSPQRAFWIEPTVERLFDAGKYFRITMLPAGQLNAENDFAQNYFNYLEKLSQGGATPDLKRFPIPEFDAMKKLMTDGLIAPRTQYSPLASWESISIKIKSVQTLSKADQFQRLLNLAPYLLTDQQELDVVKFEHIKPPPAKRSLFKGIDEIGRPSAGAEQLSAQYQIPHRVTVLDKPMWGGDNNSYPILMGAWDIGKVESRLIRPVYEVAIGIDGEIAVGETVAETQRLKNDDTCEEGFKQITSKKLHSRYEEIEKPLMFFRFGTQPALTKAKVTIKKLNKAADTEDLAVEDDSNDDPKLAAAQQVIDRERTIDSFNGNKRIIGFGATANSGITSPMNMLPQPSPVPAPELAKAKAIVNIAKAKTVVKKLTKDTGIEKDDSGLELTTTLIDIDRDGVADLFVWDDGIDHYDHRWPGNKMRTRLIFANVAGQWFLLDADQEHACGC